MPHADSMCSSVAAKIGLMSVFGRLVSANDADHCRFRLFELPDGPIALDLKWVLDRTYDAGGYGKYIYQEIPEPPLSENETEWARAYIPGS